MYRGALAGLWRVCASCTVSGRALAPLGAREMGGQSAGPPPGDAKGSWRDSIPPEVEHVRYSSMRDVLMRAGIARRFSLIPSSLNFQAFPKAAKLWSTMELITHGKARPCVSVMVTDTGQAREEPRLTSVPASPQVHGKELSLEDLRRVASLAGIKLARF